jgi:hypothetical protein
VAGVKEFLAVRAEKYNGGFPTGPQEFRRYNLTLAAVLITVFFMSTP